MLVLVTGRIPPKRSSFLVWHNVLPKTDLLRNLEGYNSLEESCIGDIGLMGQDSENLGHKLCAVRIGVVEFYSDELSHVDAVSHVALASDSYYGIR